MSNDPRKEVSRLIFDGLMGRTVMQLFHELEKRFAERSEMISDSTFYRWLAGESFPASLHRKKILAEVLGGPCGEAILKTGGTAPHYQAALQTTAHRTRGDNDEAPFRPQHEDVRARHSQRRGG
jgi:hypothetical protein